MKQTAVEWLLEQMPKKLHSHYRKQLEQAKKMEKQQIIDYHNFIISKFVMLEYTYNTKPEIIIQQYYNETFKSE